MEENKTENKSLNVLADKEAPKSIMKSKYKKNYVQYQILSNLSCNLDCTYCYENKTKQKNNYEDIIEYLKILMDRDRDQYEEVYLDWIGGEPFLVVGMMDRVNQWLDDNAASYGFKRIGFTHSTNGTLFLRPKVQEYLLKWKNYSTYGISIDGNKETHDEARIFRGSRKGSYDIILEGLKWVLDVAKIPQKNLSVKATYTKSTFRNYTSGLIAMTELGVRKVNANMVFEETLDKEWGILGTSTLMDVMDHFIDTGAYKSINFTHVIEDGEVVTARHNFKAFSKPDKLKENWCGSCDQMICLGFDKKVYGCNRFLTMDKPNMEIGYIEDGKIIPVNQDLKKEVMKQFEYLSPTCKSCPVQTTCASCVAIAYEEDVVDVEKYVQARKHCGWTWSKNIAGRYAENKLRIVKMKEHAIRLAEHNKNKMKEV